MPLDPQQLQDIAAELRGQARELGFADCRISDGDLGDYRPRLEAWLAEGLHGEMAFMDEHARLRTRPAELWPGTLRVISLRMDYWPREAEHGAAVLADPRRAYLARYALNRDYHKVIRTRLVQLGRWLGEHVAPHHHRVFCDSAPLLEKGLAERAGLGWIGKHSNLINRRAGSWFLLGEICTDLALPVDPPSSAGHCGNCSACLPACPTGAIVRPWVVDARRCISYLTIELKGSIPETLRPMIGNRVFGCDDCQLACPWNRFATPTDNPVFQPRHGLDGAALSELFGWEESTFLARTAGSPLRRAGWLRWLRNLAVALGNAPTEAPIVAALRARADHPSPLVREHVAWALARHGTR